MNEQQNSECASRRAKPDTDNKSSGTTLEPALDLLTTCGLCGSSTSDNVLVVPTPRSEAGLEPRIRMGVHRGGGVQSCCCGVKRVQGGVAVQLTAVHLAERYVRVVGGRIHLVLVAQLHAQLGDVVHVRLHRLLHGERLEGAGERAVLRLRVDALLPLEAPLHPRRLLRRVGRAEARTLVRHEDAVRRQRMRRGRGVGKQLRGAVAGYGEGGVGPGGS